MAPPCWAGSTTVASHEEGEALSSAQGEFLQGKKKRQGSLKLRGTERGSDSNLWVSSPILEVAAPWEKLGWGGLPDLGQRRPALKELLRGAAARAWTQRNALRAGSLGEGDVVQGTGAMDTRLEHLQRRRSS